MSNNFTIKQVIDIVDKNIEMENKFDCSKVDLMHTIIVQKEKIDKAKKYIDEEVLFEDMFGEGEDTFLEDVNTKYYKGLKEILGDKE